MGPPLLRLRSDEQLVALFRAGHEEAFRAIYDRYRQRLFAYTRQMLPGSRQDAEDALQDVFVRAYSGLRANDRQLALRAWLYRVAHNRCIDELRRPVCSSPELLDLVSSPMQDPLAEAERRESLRRLVADVRRLPDQQRSALLMRELSGLSYSQLADVLGVSVAAVKSLLVRARIGLVQAGEARDTACSEIRDQLIVAHDRGVRPSGMARRHMHDCTGCREFRDAIKGSSRQLAALTPTAGPLAIIGNVLFGGAGGGGGALAAGGTGGTAAATGAIATGATHVATMLAAAVVTAGGAVELQHTIGAAAPHASHHQAVSVRTVVSSAPAADPQSSGGVAADPAPTEGGTASAGGASAGAPKSSTSSSSLASEGSSKSTAVSSPSTSSAASAGSGSSPTSSASNSSTAALGAGTGTGGPSSSTQSSATGTPSSTGGFESPQSAGGTSQSAGSSPGGTRGTSTGSSTTVGLTAGSSSGSGASSSTGS